MITTRIDNDDARLKLGWIPKKLTDPPPQSVVIFDGVPYPCTIMAARYSGSYEGGSWIAFALYPDDINPDAAGEDAECMIFFSESADHVGRGSTPDKALADLTRRLMDAS